MGLLNFWKKTEFESKAIGIEKDEDVNKAFSVAITSAPDTKKVSLFPTKITDATANACVTLISDTVTASHLFVEEFTKNAWVKVNSQDSRQLMIDRPEPKVSQSEFIALIVQSMQVYNFACVIKIKVGIKVYLRCIKTYEAYFNTNEFGEFLSVEYRSDVYNKDDFIIINRPSILKDPASPWEIAKEFVNASREADKSTNALSKSQGIFTGIISPAGAALNADSFDKFKKDIKMVKDSRNGLLVTNHKTNFLHLSEPPASQDDLVNSYRKRKALAFRVPPTLLGDLQNATYNNVQTTEIFFWNHVIRPLMTTIEERLSMELYDSKLRYRFDVSKVDALVVNFTNRLEAAKNAPPGIPFDQLNEKLSLGFDSFSRSDESLVPAGLVPAQELGGDL